MTLSTLALMWPDGRQLRVALVCLACEGHNLLSLKRS